MSYVLDASAVLAWLNGEEGAERVEELLEDGMISAVNLAEVGSRLVDAGGSPEEVAQAIALLGLPVASFDAADAETSTNLRAATRAAGLSLGDRACLALAIREAAPAVTADRAWAKLSVGCEVELIR